MNNSAYVSKTSFFWRVSASKIVDGESAILDQLI
jgi:hypothetical protein